MAKIRYVDWNADQWLTGTYELTLEERGVYVTIVNMLYSKRKPWITITADWPRQFKCHGSTLKAILKRLENLRKIERKGAEISVERCREEIEKTAKRMRNAVENGAKGGRRSTKSDTYEKGSVSDLGNQQEQPNTNTITIINTKESPPKSNPPMAEDCVADAPSPARGMRLPNDFVMPDEWLQEGESVRYRANLPPIDIHLARDTFLAHFKAATGQSSRKMGMKGWYQAWQNWCRNTDPDRGKGRERNTRTAATERFDRTVSFLSDYVEKAESRTGDHTTNRE